ncbi:hypothetical protein [Allobranchiibius huperziae]|uniref:Uncharacterized protein n=1 Tax=Allobranchiibius huperziae TaxID=1874116 RepID=A0A853DEY1_9MICO|nr:hypothetical protein [Allobranchiibius huperziae]NYJ76116.1 hypothetical protein [Allobranchiibius huperziae]
MTVPAGAARMAGAPSTLPGPVMGAPRSASLIDTSRFWRVPMTMQQSQRWLAAHAPGGLSATGSASSTSGSVVTSVGSAYTDDRPSSAWQNAMLDIGIAPAGASASVWRADGTALWLDSTPATAPAGGSRLAVTVASGCPRSDRGASDVTPGPASSLLPAGSPTAGLICSYNGLNGAAFALRSRARLDTTQAGRLARSATTIDLAHTDGGSVVCPNDDESVTVVAFSYADGARASLWLTETGCRSISNGTIDAGDYPSLSAFATTVAGLLPR